MSMNKEKAWEEVESSAKHNLSNNSKVTEDVTIEYDDIDNSVTV